MYSENTKIIIRLDSFSEQIKNKWVIFRLISVYQSLRLLNFANLQYFSLALAARSCRVTDAAFMAETAVWPIFFLMNVFFSFKGS